jgi:hypothetical protein
VEGVLVGAHQYILRLRVHGMEKITNPSPQNNQGLRSAYLKASPTGVVFEASGEIISLADDVQIYELPCSIGPQEARWDSIHQSRI